MINIFNFFYQIVCDFLLPIIAGKGFSDVENLTDSDLFLEEANRGGGFAGLKVGYFEILNALKKIYSSTLTKKIRRPFFHIITHMSAHIISHTIIFFTPNPDFGEFQDEMISMIILIVFALSLLPKAFMKQELNWLAFFIVFLICILAGLFSYSQARIEYIFAAILAGYSVHSLGLQGIIYFFDKTYFFWGVASDQQIP